MPEMYPFNSLGQYTLAGRKKPPPSRVRLACPSPLQSAVKHTILKNPLGTVKSRPNLRVSLAKSITIGTHKYVIDPAIYPTLLEIIGDIPVTSLTQLQQFIAQARQATGTVNCNPAVLPARLNRQYTYRGNPFGLDPFHTSYPHPYKIGEVTPTPAGILDFITNLSNVYNYGLISGETPNSYFLEVIRDDKSGYTHLYLDMFPDGPASKYGSMIQPIPSLALFQANPANKVFVTSKQDIAGNFFPIICLIRPESWNIYGGSQLTQIALVTAFLDSLNVMNYIYTPVPFKIFLENTVYTLYDVEFVIDQNAYNNGYEYPIGTNFRFITTNGGLVYDKSFLDNSLRKFNVTRNVNYPKLFFDPLSKYPCKNKS